MIQELETKLKDFELFDEKLKYVSSEINKVKNEKEKLKSDINLMEQRMKMNDIEIVGVPETKNENTLEVVERISTNLNVTDVKGKKENCYRLHFPTKGDKPRPIVVKFKFKSMKTLV
ncbi:hypothetical protein HHI36_000528 [Cryptolaemus montrouzieri]|uniref:Uncharacterized protein n=1 Tax=Cryptolaemus montrouzieri TaxID=559131 RepID=A0ABD2P5D3_9CUCU